MIIGSKKGLVKRPKEFFKNNRKCKYFENFWKNTIFIRVQKYCGSVWNTAKFSCSKNHIGIHRIWWCSRKKRFCLRKTNIFHEVRPYFCAFFSDVTKTCSNFLVIKLTEIKASIFIFSMFLIKITPPAADCTKLRILSPKKIRLQLFHNWQIPHWTKLRRTKFSWDKIFRRTKFSSPSRYFVTFVQRSFVQRSPHIMNDFLMMFYKVCM